MTDMPASELSKPWGDLDACAQRLVGSSYEKGLDVDADELPLGEATRLVVKTMVQQRFVESAKLSCTAGLHETVNHARLIFDGQGEDLQGTDSCRPVFGVCIQNGQYVFVIHPNVYTFDELCEHGLLSVDDVLVLTHAANRVRRQSNRIQLRQQRERQAREQGLDPAAPEVARWIKKSRSAADAATEILGSQAMPKAAQRKPPTA
ncbi:hypothetical protein [Comamonas sp. BIGb0124]|uniref:hypothetical protein n=1 Tax=Comamonas sp. BIGb0124 TaxID=2485130 RepID=UPI0011CDFBCB|nr:hypothetical protein [Comamonas sp. BIGb0124]